MGGNNAQSVILFASALENDKKNLENMLGRLLKRTVSSSSSSSSSSSFSTPPSHLLLISSHGTSRTNITPYSLQNFALLGSGKLDKLSELESTLKNVVRGRVIGKQFPLDYTIVKLGDVVSEEEERKKWKDAAIIGKGEKDEGGVTSVVIRPGDALDGPIGPNAAAHVVLEALAYQPYARNMTLCAEGYYCCDDDDGDTYMNGKIRRIWNDKFLCLSGPELLRMEVAVVGSPVVNAVTIGSGAAKEVDTADVDTKFEQLSQYIQLWATKSYGDSEDSRKSTSGLTTPVIVRPSSLGSISDPASLGLDGVLSRNGVRILFQMTNTGDRYKSASEEREDEKMRSSGGGATKKASPTIIVGKARKEGGIEILIEKTLDNTVRVRARRCNMDDKTIVKEMSESVILKSLKKAVESWFGAG
jgi:hypothetical protein